MDLPSAPRNGLPLMTTTTCQPAVTAAARSFTNFFSGSKEPEAPTPTNTNAEDADAALRINVADLANGDDMPPMLQYNPALVEAALAMLEFANGDGVAEEELQAVSGIVGMLFGEGFTSPYQQYLTVARFTDIPRVRQPENSHVLKAAHCIQMVILPTTLAELVVTVDAAGEFASTATDAERDLVHGLVEAITDHGGSDGAAGSPKKDPDEALLAALQAVERGFPTLFQHSQFIHLLQDMNRVCLQARFSYLVNETCLAFDPERTGRIKLAELEESLGKLMPPPAVKRMMAGVEPDDDGTVFYPQMAMILMRGEAPVAAQGTEPPAPEQGKPDGPSA